MKDLRQIQKKKGIRLIIFSILLCFFGIIIFSISNEDKTINLSVDIVVTQVN